jgi:hypothetical protein
MTEHHEQIGPTRRQVLRAAAGASLVGLGFGGLGACREEPDVPESLTYDVTDYAKIDPALINWRQVAVHELNLHHALDVGFMEGRLVVIGPAGLRIVDPASPNDVERWALPAEPTALAVVGTDVYLALRDHVEQWRQGEKVRAWPTLDAQAHITSIAVDGQDLYIAEANGRQVIRYRGTDEVWRVEGFVVPSPYFDVCVHEGRVWVADTGRHKLKAYDATGELTASIGRTGLGIEAFCGCCNPCHFLILADGRFVTAEKGLHRVKVLGPDGSLAGAVGGAERFGIDVYQPTCRTLECSGPAGPIPVLVDAGRLAVVHPVTGRVHVFEQTA